MYARAYCSLVAFPPSVRITERTEQRYCIKFCQKLGEMQSDTIRKVQLAFGDEAMCVTQIKFWYNRFKNGRGSIESDMRPGMPSTSRNPEMAEKVRALVMGNRRITIREIENELGIAYGSAQAILTEELCMRRVAAKFVPKLLTREQQDLRLDVAQDMLNCANQDPQFMKKIITGDETWVYGYDPEAKVESSQWKSPSSPRPKKARQVRSKVKAMLTVFFDDQGVVHHEYAPEGQTINKQYYLEVLRRLRDAVRRKRPALWATQDWQLHHDNAPAHSAHLIQEFLAKHGITQVREAP